MCKKNLLRCSPETQSRRKKAKIEKPTDPWVYIELVLTSGNIGCK